jgi:hypothetical protein
MGQGRDEEANAMFKTIEDLPNGAVGFEAHGRVTDADRRKVLEPVIEWALESQDKVRLLYVAAPDFAGYEHKDVYDDAIFGTRHFADFERIAFVADEGPYARSVAAVGGLMPGDVRIFTPDEIGDAKAWLAG